ncbi:MAG TPA: HAD hydrolase family protein [Candidatus Eisenbacteria bacterium]|nr:HAD hydrolase family protein [Candidatus Eisenbacteria bacterium]
MIRAIILDIDGVIVGQKIGFNFPSPHEDVLKKLREIKEKGIAIALCTAKPAYAISDIIEGAQLNNPHITDAGAVIINPIDTVIVEKHVIEKDFVKNVLETCLSHNIYVELYTVDEYFIQQNQVGEITEKHKPILRRDPIVVSSLLHELSQQDVVRIMPIAKDEEDKKRVADLLDGYKNTLSISWGLHPSALPLQFGIITSLGSSKKEGAEAVVKNLNLSFEDVLGIGDTTGDWSFMQLCGHVATVENGSSELKDLLRTKGEGKYFIGKSVDENGILDIFNFFQI